MVDFGWVVSVETYLLTVPIMPVFIDVAMVKCLWVLCSSQVVLMVAFLPSCSPQSFSLLPSTFLAFDS